MGLTRRRGDAEKRGKGEGGSTARPSFVAFSAPPRLRVRDSVAFLPFRQVDAVVIFPARRPALNLPRFDNAFTTRLRPRPQILSRSARTAARTHGTVLRR